MEFDREEEILSPLRCIHELCSSADASHGPSVRTPLWGPRVVTPIMGEVGDFQDLDGPTYVQNFISVRSSKYLDPWPSVLMVL